MTARRLRAVDRGPSFTITVNGQPVQACAGESVAAALMAAGLRAFRRTVPGGAPRGLFCGIGMCFDCLVTLDGVENVRACMAEARAGSVVETYGGEGVQGVRE